MDTVQGIKVRQKRPNLWTTTIRVEPGPKGRRSIYGRTEAEVAEKAQAILAEVQQLTRDLPKYEVGTFADFVYVTYRPRVLKKRKATTQRSYDSQLSLHILPGLGHLPIRAIGFEELGAWADSLTRKTHKGECTGQPLPDRRKTECILRAKEILHLFGQLASGKGEQVRTDWRLVETPKKRRKADPQEPEEGYGLHTQKLLEASMGTYMAGPHFCAAVLGLRRGEVCGLTWDRIDRKRMTIRIDRQLSPETGSEFVSTKGDTRTIPVTEAILGMIDKLGSRGSIFVFADKKGHHLRPNEVSKRTPAICRKAEITPVTFHTLRHHAASNLLALGVDLVTVCEVLGHTDIKTTMIYVSARSQGKREGLQLALSSILAPVGNGPVSVDKDALHHRQEA